MRIAIPLVNGRLSLHFGHCQQFALMDVDPEARRVIAKQYVVPPPHEPGALPRWLHEHGANVIIAGGMGQRAVQLFAQNGIEVIVGASDGEPDEIAAAYLQGNLATGTNVCDH